MHSNFGKVGGTTFNFLDLLPYAVSDYVKYSLCIYPGKYWGGLKPWMF